jgi:hypothetical protein
MKTFGLLVLVAFLAVLTVPPLRQWAAPTLGPAADLIAGQMEPAVLRVRDPFYEWGTRKELRRFAKELQERHASRTPLPETENFPSYLARRHHSDGFDRWGRPYYLLMAGDSVIVGSAGPDGIPFNEDDVREGFSRTTR